MKNDGCQSLQEYLGCIKVPTLILASHHWPLGINCCQGGKASLLTVFDLNLEAAGICNMHQISAAIDLFGAKEIALIGHYPGKLTCECLPDMVDEDESFDRLAGVSKFAEGDGFSIGSEKLVRAAIFLQVQFQYLQYFLNHSKWKYSSQKPSLHALLLGEDRIIYLLDEIERKSERLPINYVLN